LVQEPWVQQVLVELPVLVEKRRPLVQEELQLYPEQLSTYP